MRFSSLCLGSLAALIVGTAGAVWAEESAKAPWEVNRPIVEVQKERYRTHRRPRESALAAVSSVGPKLELCEVQSYQTLSDVGEEIRARWSTDNGRTWSEFVPLQASNLISYENVPVWEGGAMAVHDPGTGRLVQLWLREIHHADLFHTFTYCRISSDLGRTWSTPKPLVYEPTVDFDPKTPLNPAYLNHNEGYPGNNILVRRDGTLVTCLAHTNAPGDPKNDQRPWRMGSVLMLGRWNAQRQEYDWQPGARVEISPEDSARGLMEPGVVELKDGRLLIVWRGSTEGYDNTVSKLPGYKFYSLSSDGGRTLTPPAPWTYSDGTNFYSASSIHHLVRHSVNGKLYWIGNISQTAPKGNSPRFPLVIAEVDETKAAPIRSSVTLIDDRKPDQGPDVQFSNFSLYEDGETHEFVLYLTTYGQEPDPADWATADCYRYRLRLP